MDGSIGRLPVASVLQTCLNRLEPPALLMEMYMTHWLSCFVFAFPQGPLDQAYKEELEGMHEWSTGAVLKTI